MNSAIISKAKNTHYAVSTFAAVVYAVVWLVSGRAHAENSLAQTATPEVVVTGHREVSQHEIPEIVVWGRREATSSVTMLEVVVYGTRETPDSQVASTSTGNGLSAKAKAQGSWVAKARHWLQTALVM